MNDEAALINDAGGDISPRFHACESDDTWTRTSAVAIANALRRDLEKRPRARLLLSGGTTPGPVFRALSQIPLDWHRVDIGLVDERWLLPSDPDSNAHLVHQHLLRNYAAAAHFETLTRAGRTIEAAVAAANLHARQDPGVIVLGMGDDGHTASLFPHMAGLEAALTSAHAYVAVDANGCPGAASWPRRISLTPAGLAPAHTRLLLLRGAGKRRVYERAAAGTDEQEMPIRIAIRTPGAPLDVYWCP
ncbi:MAG: 6-phosphogluconolactonase [Luteimonas sp.]